MRFIVCAVGHRMPAWVNAAFGEYVRRLPRETPVDLVEVRPAPRPAKAASAAQIARSMATEAERIRAALPTGCTVVALDEKGKSFTSVEFGQRLERCGREARGVPFVIGSADGLAPELKRGASLVLSLSSLTLPHRLVRVLLAEQLYRGVSLLHNHPYHRE